MRAPLVLRLVLLRKIADADRNNLIWQEDLETFERARIEEIKSEVKPLCNTIDQAVDAQQHAVLENLFRELTEPAWTEQPPQGVIQQIETTLHDSSQRLLYEELKQTEISLNDAFNEYDIEKAITLRDQWDRTLDRCELPYDDEVITRAQSALGWIREEEIRKQQSTEVAEAIHTIEHLLENAALIGEIDAQIAIATKYDDPLPDYIVERIEQYRVRYAARRKQRFILITVTACLFLVGLTGLGFYLARRSHDANQIMTRQNDLQNLVDTEQWEAVLATIAKMPENKRNAHITAFLLKAKEQLEEIERWRKKNSRLVNATTKQYEQLAKDYEENKSDADAEDISILVDFRKDAYQLTKDAKRKAKEIRSSENTLKTTADRSKLLSQENDLGRIARDATKLNTDIQTAINRFFTQRLNALAKKYNSSNKSPKTLNDLEAKLTDLKDEYADYIDRDLLARSTVILKEIEAKLSQTNAYAS